MFTFHELVFVRIWALTEMSFPLSNVKVTCYSSFAIISLNEYTNVTFGDIWIQKNKKVFYTSMKPVLYSLGCLGCTLCYDDDEKWHQHRIQSNTFVLCFWIICYWNFVKSDVIFDQFCDDCNFFVKSSHCPSFS